MAFFTLNTCLVVGLVVLCLAFEAEARNRHRSRPSRGKGNRGFESFGGCSTSQNDNVNKNISALWSHMKFLSQPIEVHVHEDNRKCDDYFGCDFGDHHGHDSHHGHSHGKHKHGSAKNGSKKHDHGHHHHSHGNHHHSHHSHHSSHDAHHSHAPAFKDNHIHIHLSVNNKDDCGFVSYAPKDKFVYARCDMVPDNGKKNGVKGSILMRQKPHGILETKIKLNGFKRESQGIKDGVHDFFFDVHQKADFTDHCKSFGAHDHVHHKEGKFDHEHDHKHEDDHKHDHGDHKHNHDHHDGHDHSVHDHHSHEDDWGNVIVNKKGVANMEVNCTHHELFGPESMLGRGIVLHDKDDKVMSCCAITYANIDDESWEKL